MTEDRYVAAIEISSSKIVAVVGKVRPDGQLCIIASEQEKGVESVRYGVIRNLEETSMRISRILSLLERKPAVAPRRITGLFVGLSGLSLRSIPTRVSINLPDDTEITDDIITRLLQQARSTAIDSSLEVMDAVPRSYTVGRLETTSPKGAVGDSISAEYDLVVCRPEIKNNLIRTVQDKLGKSIKGIVVTALASGQLILSAEEKRLGCMLVDMGGETTTVSIYKNGHLVYFATLPLGGRNITRDLTSLNILEERAEEIKITSGLKDTDLPGGIVVIGGASKLNGMLDLLSNKSSLNVRRGTLPQYIILEDTKISSGEIIDVASVLYAGATGNEAECLERPAQERVPVTGDANTETGPEPEVETKKPHRHKSGGWGGKITGWVSSMFGNAEDDSDPLD